LRAARASVLVEENALPCRLAAKFRRIILKKKVGFKTELGSSTIAAAMALSPLLDLLLSGNIQTVQIIHCGRILEDARNLDPG
jgi:hypothetical protein